MSAQVKAATSSTEESSWTDAAKPDALVDPLRAEQKTKGRKGDNDKKKSTPSAAGGAAVSKVSPSRKTKEDYRKKKTSVGRLGSPGPNALSIYTGWGVCDTETVAPALKMKKKKDEWVVKGVDFHGNYSKINGLLPGVTEIGGPGADTTQENYLKQMGDLRYVADDYEGEDPGGATEWYMVNAVDAHESVHEKRLAPALKKVSGSLAAKFTPLTAPAVKGETPEQGAAKIQSKAAYATAVSELRDIWDDKYVDLIGSDHDKLAPAAEHKVVDPMIKNIKKWKRGEDKKAKKDEKKARKQAKKDEKARLREAKAQKTLDAELGSESAAPSGPTGTTAPTTT